MTDAPHTKLKKLFHEPNRLAIMSALCRAAEGLLFNELKEECSLTDGNLSRHIKTLKEAGVIEVNKFFKGVKPLTRVVMNDTGREHFVEYLTALEEVLKDAASALGEKRADNHGVAGDAVTV